MKKKNMSILFVIGFLEIYSIHAEILSSDRRIDWRPGIPGGFPNKDFIVNVKDFGASGNGTIDDYQAFTSAIDALAIGGGGVIYIPEGFYLIKNTLAMQNGIVFRGEGSEKTHLYFHLGNEEKNCIDFVKYDRGTWIKMITGYTKNSKQITVQDASSFNIGDFVEIQQDNDPDIMYTQDQWNKSWAQGAVGQILVVEAINGNNLTLHNGLYIEYRAELNPIIRRLGLVEYAGIEKLHLKRLDSGDGNTILLKNAAYCRIMEIESEYSSRSHVNLETAFKCEIRDNYFHHSYVYDESEYGDGVICSFHATDNLIENNIFQRLRHSFMIHLGASGNVFSYNYSFDLYDPNTWSPVDLALQGYYLNYNLFESNIIQEIGVGNYGGPAGPGNTFFRNIIETRHVTVSDHSHYQNIIGNVFSTDNQFIYIETSVYHTVVHGNTIRGIVEWDPNISNHNFPFSYYLDSKPDFFGDKPWPLLGSDVSYSDILLPAKERYENSIATGIRMAIPTAKELRLTVYPNPFNPVTNISYDLPKSAVVEVKIYDINGKLISILIDEYQEKGERIISWASKDSNGQRVPSGLYLIVLKSDNTIKSKKVLLLK